MLYYIHGYLSGPDSTKGMILKEKLGVIPVKYRDCPPEELIISDCVSQIIKEIKDDPEAVLIGSSLGGLLAAKTAQTCANVKTLILLNPAIIPTDIDISKISDMPQSILSDMQDGRLFNEKIKSEIFILAGTLDDVVPNCWVVRFAQAQQATLKFLHDDHSFTQNKDNLPDILIKFLNEKNYQ